MEVPNTICQVHTVHMDDDCQFCVAETDELQAMYNRIVKENGQKASMLASLGGQLDNSSILAARIDLILDALYGQDPKARGRFEVTFARQVQGSLENALQEMRKAKLTQGVTPGGLIL